MSYSNMKPMSPEVHQHLADWVNKGGVLIYCGKDDDPYQKVMEWWNTGANHYAAPSGHLFQLLHIKPTAPTQSFPVGKGKVYVIRQNPKEFVMQTNNDTSYISLLKTAYSTDAKAGELIIKNNFYLQRGPYDIISVMNEGASSEPYVINGPVIDLFDPQLPALTQKTVQPGTQAFLYNIGRVADKKKPQVLASACRIYDETIKDKTYTFIAKSPLNTRNSMRVLLPAAPTRTTCTNSKGENLTDVNTSWDAVSGTCYLGFDNSPEGIKVTIEW
jgi:hypothetical protein